MFPDASGSRSESAGSNGAPFGRTYIRLRLRRLQYPWGSQRPCHAQHRHALIRSVRCLAYVDPRPAKPRREVSGTLTSRKTGSRAFEALDGGDSCSVPGRHSDLSSAQSAHSAIRWLPTLSYQTQDHETPSFVILLHRVIGWMCSTPANRSPATVRAARRRPDDVFVVTTIRYSLLT